MRAFTRGGAAGNEEVKHSSTVSKGRFLGHGDHLDMKATSLSSKSMFYSCFGFLGLNL